MMTIKEVERLTEMPRASIRFYEAEALVRPEREKNGYRIYTRENVDDLLRIRLLRALDVPIEEIREIMAGRLTLQDCFARRLTRLEEGQEKLARSVEVCRRLAGECVEFRALDAAQYLSWLEGGAPARTPAPEQSAEEPKPGIWRRLLARSVDYTLYTLLWELLLVTLFRVNLAEGVTREPTLLAQFLENIVVLALMMLFEPLFLWQWGTTPGKWSMGVRVTDDKGERLSYREAAGRCWSLLLYGYGLGIPILTLIRQIRSLQNYRRGEEPEWEWYSRLQLREKGRIRAAVAYMVCAALLLAVQIPIRAIPEIPPNRGDLAAAEFAENFNTLQRYYEQGTNDYIFSGDMRELSVAVPWELDASGCWTAREGYLYAWINKGEPPEVTLHVNENGTVSGVALAYREEWKSGEQSDAARRGRDFQRHIFLMRVAAQAFGGAQTEMLAPGSGWRTVMELVANGWRQEYAFSLRGVAVAYDVEFSGCAPDEGGAPWLEEEDGAEDCFVAYTFTVRLSGAPAGSVIS